MENEFEIPDPDQNYRNLAGLAHASVILPYLGAVVPILIWATRKDKSSFLAFQALQAMIYQISIMVIWFVGFMCYFVTFLGNILSLPLVVSKGGEIDTLPWVASFVPFLTIAIILLVGFAYILYGIVGAIQVYHGKPFRYIVIGKWAENIWHTRKNKGGEI